ncbi:hypothetical protein SmJEL517_g02479 [Synchytrium microbalum]|uniref:dolichol kinase n=1 Tax=Synchytrium microbalum TaxID=1806994 RepID=A0A507C1U8_9FUNG|nr:uncharacterized protein SmJEL517_g02479 [Synchytrium microbalum]TPX35097.1 hypothetical protein SmJEL517_g02479 [Synchytrium microbalum]
MSGSPLTPREIAEIGLTVAPTLYLAWHFYNLTAHSAQSWGLLMICVLAVENQWKKHRPWGTSIGDYRPSSDQGLISGSLIAPLTACSILWSNMSSETEFASSHLATLSISFALLANIFLVSSTNTIDVKRVIMAGLVVFRMCHQSGLAFWMIGPCLATFSMLYYITIAILRRSFTAGEAILASQLLSLACISSALAALPNPYNGIVLKWTATYIMLLALIPGMLAIGVLTNTVLIYSKSTYLDVVKVGNPSGALLASYRIWISLAFVAGAALTVLFGISPLVSARLNLNPFVWTVDFVFTKGGSTRINVLCYLAFTLLLGVSLTTRLFDSKKRANTNETNLKRKYFHFLAFVMFLPCYLVDPEFLHLAFSLATSIFILTEYARFFRLAPVGDFLHTYLSQFADARDTGPAILSHVYLLLGCAIPVWLAGGLTKYGFQGCLGIVALGVGDSLAAIIGQRHGRHRWPHSRKTVEGTAVFIVSVFLCWVVAVLLGVARRKDLLPALFSSVLGGKSALAALWGPYELYGKVDKVYSQEAYYRGDGFGTAQTWMNVVELAFQFGGIYLVVKKHPAGALVVATAQLMTFWKTVLYFLADILGGFDNTKQNDAWTFLSLYLIPNGMWLVFPGFISAKLGHELFKFFVDLSLTKKLN